MFRKVYERLTAAFSGAAVTKDKLKHCNPAKNFFYHLFQFPSYHNGYYNIWDTLRELAHWDSPGVSVLLGVAC